MMRIRGGCRFAVVVMTPPYDARVRPRSTVEAYATCDVCRTGRCRDGGTPCRLNGLHSRERLSSGATEWKVPMTASTASLRDLPLTTIDGTRPRWPPG